jgi:hypothetical protein
LGVRPFRAGHDYDSIEKDARMATISTPDSLAHAFTEQFGTPTQGSTRVKRVDLVPAESPEGDDVWRIVLTLAAPGPDDDTWPVDDTNALRRNARQTLAEVLSRVSDISDQHLLDLPVYVDVTVDADDLRTEDRTKD